MPDRELGLPQSAEVRAGRLQVRNPLGVSDCGLEVADFRCQECRSTLDRGISLIGRDTVQRDESVLETPSLFLDYTQPLQRVIPVLPLAGIS
jgi:hypothetical protein